MASWRRSGVFIVNYEHISHLVLVFLLLTLSKEMLAGSFSSAEVGEVFDMQLVVRYLKFY